VEKTKVHIIFYNSGGHKECLAHREHGLVPLGVINCTVTIQLSVMFPIYLCFISWSVMHTPNMILDSGHIAHPGAFFGGGK
jgi:hypothetical protein